MGSAFISVTSTAPYHRIDQGERSGAYEGHAAYSLTMARELSLQEIIDSLTWDDLLADGIITTEEIDAMLRAKGLDPGKLDYLYD